MGGRCRTNGAPSRLALRATHERPVVEASKDLRNCDLIALAQYRHPVVTTPDSAVLKLKEILRR